MSPLGGGCVFFFLPVCACCVCVCLHYSLCSWQQGVQVDTVTVPHRATERPCHPTTEALSLCSSWLVMDFLLSLSLFSLFPPPFFIEPIFLSEVLIWGTGQWARGTEGGEDGRRGGQRRCGVVMAADGRPFVPPFPGSSPEPLRLQLR